MRIVLGTRESGGVYIFYPRTPLDRVLRLFYAIRDNICCDPYLAMGKKESYRASDCLQPGRGCCVSKAGLIRFNVPQGRVC